MGLFVGVSFLWCVRRWGRGGVGAGVTSAPVVAFFAWGVFGRFWRDDVMELAGSI